MAYNCVHLPAGYKVEIETTAGSGTFTDLGVTMADGSLAWTYDTLKITGSRAEAIKNAYKNMKMEASFSLAQLDLANIAKLTGGATAYTAQIGTPVVGATYTLVADTWEYNTFYPFPHQQYDGVVPTTISAANDGAIVADTDYYIMQGDDGLWGFMVLDTVDTDNAYNLVFTYSYTPATSRTLTGGSASVDIAARAMKISKELDTGKWWIMTIYAAVNTAGLTFTLPRYDADDISTLDVTMEGQLDTTRTDLDQLFSIVDQYGAAGI
jgi:hypothetical protein